MRRIGLVVNPIAGMGGRVGLKGTDGKVAAARERGAEPRAPDRARDALAALDDAPGADAVDLIACGEPMGAAIAREAGFDPTVTSEPADPEATTAADTRAAVRTFADADVDLVLFVGGDGTAVDVAEALAAAAGASAPSPADDESPAAATGESPRSTPEETPSDATAPMLGVPAGVKVYSEVFAVSPAAAGRVAATFDAVERAEVNDVDEDRYRAGEVHTELRAVATVPVADRRQSAKQLAGGSVEGLAAAVADDVREGVTYAFGPGSTVGAVEAALGFEGSPLGVDVWRDGEVLVRDGGESDVLAALGEENVVVVSPIGGQGFVFGRGNQQLSPAVIRDCEVVVVASRRKLDGLGVLRVDTGDPELDAELRGWQRVRVGAYETRLMEVV